MMDSATEQMYKPLAKIFIGYDIGRDLLNNVRSFMTQNVEPIISAFDEKIKAVESFKSNEKIKSEKLAALLKRTENLIGEIQACR